MKIVVVGGGPGGYVAAIRAASLGACVTLVERDTLGGTCLNRGCIPTKALLHTGELYTNAMNGHKAGVIAKVELDFAKAQEKKNATVSQLVAGINGLMKGNKIKVIKGTASFTDKDTLVVDGEGLAFDKIILATGSRPVMPPIPGIEHPQCLTSDEALELEEVPKSMAIIGGGVIGIEMATIYGALGCEITILEMMDEILPFMDRELVKILRNKLESQGIKIITNGKVVSIEDKGRVASLNLSNQEKVEVEKVLVSVGREVDTEALNLRASGIAHEKGKILVDNKQQTNLPNIYGIGDCTGGVMLAHVASIQGEIAAENAMGHDARYDEKTNPSCVYTNPEFAGVGLTEEQVKERNIDYIVGRFPLFANGKSLIMGSTEGMVKIIAGKKYGELLGIHILGPKATELIAQGALAIGVEATLDEMIETIYPHPTVSESIREAAMVAYGRGIHI